MALSEELPIYKATFSMLGMVVERVKSFPRFYRYTVGEKMVNINLEMISLIYRANSNYDKLPLIIELCDRYHMLVMLFRLSVEQHLLTPAQYARYAMQINIIGRQLTGWKQHNNMSMLARKIYASCL